MLVLSRREGENILAGEFEIRVLEVGEDIVQLRISHSPNAERIFVEIWVGVGEEFRIGKSILGTIAAIRNATASICLEAPREITILRGEIIGPRFPGIH